MFIEFEIDVCADKLDTLGNPLKNKIRVLSECEERFYSLEESATGSTLESNQAQLLSIIDRIFNLIVDVKNLGE